MADDDGSSLSRRLHWDAEGGTPATSGVDPDAWHEPVGWSIEATPADARPADARPAAARAADAIPFVAVTPAPSFERRDLDRIEADALDRRRQLWRDTALILSGLVAVLLVANLVLPQIAGLVAASPSPGASGMTVGPNASAQGAAGATRAPTAGPGSGTPRPPTSHPLVTLPPTGSHPPSTPKPVVTPKPTRRPTAPPPTAPLPTPTPTPEITPAPPSPVAAFTWSQPLPLTISFSDASTATTAWQWDFGDGTTSSQRNPDHVYALPGDYVVRLTVTGPGGTDAVEKTVTVAGT